MARNEYMWIMIAIVALVVVGMFIQSKYDVFAILPAGQCNAYSNNLFTTSVNPLASSYDDYAGTGAWVAIDTNSDGVKEEFGYSSRAQTSSTSGMAECGGGTAANKGTLKVENFNTAGDDIYYYQSTNANWIYVCAANKQTARYFNQDNANSANAMQSCGGTTPVTCTNGQTQSCSAANTCAGTQTCTNNAWGACTTTLQKCSDGSCQASCPGTGTGGTIVVPACPSTADLLNYGNRWLTC
jgi:hypothetical protein